MKLLQIFGSNVIHAVDDPSEKDPVARCGRKLAGSASLHTVEWYPEPAEICSDCSKKIKGNEIKAAIDDVARMRKEERERTAAAFETARKTRLIRDEIAQKIGIKFVEWIPNIADSQSVEYIPGHTTRRFRVNAIVENQSFEIEVTIK